MGQAVQPRPVQGKTGRFPPHHGGRGLIRRPDPFKKLNKIIWYNDRYNFLFTQKYFVVVFTPFVGQCSVEQGWRHL